MNRLPGFNYSSPASYFITICTKNRINWFGKIRNKKMELNAYGNIVSDTWSNIPRYYKNVLLDEWIIMPNHLHGIIHIIGDIVGDEQCFAGDGFVGDEHCFAGDGFVGDEHCFAGDGFVGDEQCFAGDGFVGDEQCFAGDGFVGDEQCSSPTGNNGNNKNYGLISKIVKSFKETSLKIIHRKFKQINFKWQRSFYDHIIRNEYSLFRIQEYIKNNPIKWELDQNHK